MWCIVWHSTQTAKAMFTVSLELKLKELHARLSYPYYLQHVICGVCMCMCGFYNVWVCVCVGFVMCGCVGFVMCGCVCVCGCFFGNMYTCIYCVFVLFHLCILILFTRLFNFVSYIFLLLSFCIQIVAYVLFCIFCLHRANWHSSATLTEVSPCFFVSCKANARV
jgi:hypothetical protein